MGGPEQACGEALSLQGIRSVAGVPARRRVDLQSPPNAVAGLDAEEPEAGRAVCRDAVRRSPGGRRRRSARCHRRALHGHGRSCRLRVLHHVISARARPGRARSAPARSAVTRPPVGVGRSSPARAYASSPRRAISKLLRGRSRGARRGRRGDGTGLRDGRAEGLRPAAISSMLHVPSAPPAACRCIIATAREWLTLSWSSSARRRARNPRRRSVRR